MSLALDRSSTMNPTTGFGRFYTDVLQIFYVTYYVWGYLPILLLGYKYVVAWRRNDGHEVNEKLAQVKLYICGWLSAFIIIFICNTSLPASSPRLFFKNTWIHPKLEGFGLAKLLIGAATDDTSFGSFPSGHFAESLIAGIYMLHLHRPTGIIVVVSSGMIGLATQALRYHYFTDLLGAAIVVVVSLSFGLCLTGKIFRRETARIVNSYATQTGVAFYGSESNSTELTIRSSDDGSVDEYDTKMEIEIDLEAAQPERPPNYAVHTLI